MVDANDQTAQHLHSDNNDIKVVSFNDTTQFIMNSNTCQTKNGAQNATETPALDALNSRLHADQFIEKLNMDRKLQKEREEIESGDIIEEIKKCEQQQAEEMKRRLDGNKQLMALFQKKNSG